MDSCCLGASNVTLLKVDFGRSRAANLRKTTGYGAWNSKTPSEHAGLALSQHFEKSQRVRCSSSLLVESRYSFDNRPVIGEPPVVTAATILAEDSKDAKAKPSPLTSQLIPDASEVESLLGEICDTTSIAEFELKLGGFRLYVMRDLSVNSIPPPPPPSAAPVRVETAGAESPDSNGSVSSQSLALAKPLTSSERIQTFLERAADDGLVLLKSPKVGFFRRSRTIKGKRAPPSCKEKQTVKEGQVVCFIEQLGGEIPVESDISGEVIKILAEDGDPIGYGDAVIAILPSFPGIKKLQ